MQAKKAKVYGETKTYRNRDVSFEGALHRHGGEPLDLHL